MAGKASVRVEASVVSHVRQAGIAVRSGSTATVTNSTVSVCGKSGVYTHGPGSTTALHASEVTRCGRILVEVAHQARSSVEHCLLNKSGGGGVMVRHSGTTASLTRNVLRDCRLAGIDAREGSGTPPVEPKLKHDSSEARTQFVESR